MLKPESETIGIPCYSIDLDSTWIVYRKLHSFDNPSHSTAMSWQSFVLQALSLVILCAAYSIRLFENPRYLAGQTRLLCLLGWLGLWRRFRNSRIHNLSAWTGTHIASIKAEFGSLGMLLARWRNGLWGMVEVLVELLLGLALMAHLVFWRWSAVLFFDSECSTSPIKFQINNTIIACILSPESIPIVVLPGNCEKAMRNVVWRYP